MERINQVLRHLRRLLQPADAVEATDRQLLERFHAERDESAFAVLVARHGPMVRGVCRRLLPDENDIDDAFQAVFLVLARRAAVLRRPASLASWLHGVSRRVALNVRRSAVRRRGHERQAGSMTPSQSAGAVPETDLRPVIDEELQRLPEKYRLPLVLCYLEGKTNEEAAQMLSWSKGTVSGRLARARDRLRLGLARRGIALTASALLVPLSAGEAALPAALKESTVQAATQFAAAGAVAAGSVSAEAVALARGVLHAMFLQRLKAAAVTVALFGVFFTGAGLLAQHVWADRSTAAATTLAADEKKEAKEVEVTLFSAYLDIALAGAHRITLNGRLGGDGQLTLDRNGCALGENGNPTTCTELRPASHRVKLLELPANADAAKRRLYDISGAPKPMRLVVPDGEGPYRLLLLDDNGKVVRVLTLEKRGAKQAAPAEVALRSAYLDETFNGGHVIKLKGKLDGDAELDANVNSFTLTQFGDLGVDRTQKDYLPLRVKFQPVAPNADREPGYKLYDVVGAREPTRLMIDVRDGGPPRLLGLKDGKVVRVVTLEPMP